MTGATRHIRNAAPWILQGLFVLMVVQVAAERPETGLVIAATVVAAVSVIAWPRQAVPALVVLLLVQPALVIAFEDVEPVAQAFKFLDEVALAAALLRVAYLLLIGDRTWFSWRDWRWALLFLGAGLASSFFRRAALVPTALGAALACKFFGFLLLSMSIPWRAADARRLCSLLAATVPIFLITGVLGSLFPKEILPLVMSDEGDLAFERGGFVSFMAPFPHPALYGWAMVSGGLAALTLVVVAGRRASLPLVVISLVGAILSLRRRPVAGLVIAGLSVATYLSRARRWAFYAVAVVIGAGAVWWGANRLDATVEDTQQYLDPDQRENTARGLLTVTSLGLASRNLPLGVGFGRFGGYASVLFYSDVYDEEGLSSVHGLSRDNPHYISDTYWPHILGETGVLGLLFLLAFFFVLWRRLRRIARPENPVPLRLAAMLASLLLLEGLVESLGGPVFEMSIQALVIAIPAGMAIRFECYGMAASLQT